MTLTRDWGITRRRTGAAVGRGIRNRSPWPLGRQPLARAGARGLNAELQEEHLVESVFGKLATTLEVHTGQSALGGAHGTQHVTRPALRVLRTMIDWLRYLRTCAFLHSA